MTPKEHYDHHLARVYSWMAGDFNTCTHEQQVFFQDQHLLPQSTGKAIDLGAGHGIQSVALARLGFSVTAIDFNQTLLSELIVNAGQLPIHTVEDDILNLLHYRSLSPELIACCGDTITHLGSKNAIDSLIQQAYAILEPDGKLLLTFRDYTHDLKGDARFIPVRSDNTRIATCFLEYFNETVRVTDLVYERSDIGWTQKVSSYEKLRISREEIRLLLSQNGFTIIFDEVVNRMIAVIAKKS